MDKFKRLSILTITVTAIISLIALFGASHLELSYDFERFFPEGDNDLKALQDFRADFESDNDLLIIAIENNAGVFNSSFLQQLEALTDTLKEAPLIRNVNSILDMQYPVKTAFGFNSFPVVHPDQPEKLIADSVRAYTTPGVVGSLVARNKPAVAIYAKTEEMLSKVESDSVLNVVESLVAGYDFDKVIFSGKTKSQQYIIDKMGHELLLFISLSAVLLIVFLWITFRAMWGIIVPILVVTLSVIWLLGAIGLTGEKIDLMASLLPSILFVVGTSDVIHILNKYLQELRKGLPKMEALKTAFKEVSIATLMTSVTTALGFLTLLSASIVPIKNFGLNAAAGVMLAYVLAFTLLPAIMSLLPIPKIAKQQVREVKWRVLLGQLLSYVLRNPKKIWIYTIAFTGMALLGISQLEVNNFLLEDLSERDPHMQEFKYFEASFAGARPLDFVVELPPDAEGDLLDYQRLQQMHQVEIWVEALFSPGFTMSPTVLAKTMNQAHHKGRPDTFAFPSEKVYSRHEKTARKMAKSKRFETHLTPDFKKARISGQIADIGGKAIAEKLDSIAGFVSAETDFEIFVTPTGTALLIDKNNTYLVQNMMTGLIIAFGAIWILMMILFKSVKLATLTLLPNILPLLTIAGLMGWSGIDMKVSTSLVFTIAFGIAVDDTLHFVSRYRLEMKKGRAPLRAIVNTYVSTGKAIIMTSFILYAGFLLLILSTFNSTFYIGLLVSTGMLAAVVFDLTLLPLILLTTNRQKNRLKG